MDQAANFASEESVQAFAKILDRAHKLETCYIFDQQNFGTKRRVKFSLDTATDEETGTIKAIQYGKEHKTIYKMTTTRKNDIETLVNTHYDEADD